MSTAPSNEVNHLRSYGYVVIRKFFPPDLLQQVNCEIRSSARFREQAGKCLQASDPYLRAFDRVMNLWKFLPKVHQVIFDSGLGRLSSDLLQCKAVRLSHDQCLYKPASGAVTPIHADQYHWPVSSEKTLTVWIPLQDTPIKMGAIRYYAGSHLLDDSKRNALSEGSPTDIDNFFKTRTFPPVEQDFDLGDIGIHYGWTFHAAGPNLTDAVRGVLTAIVMEDGIRLLKPRPDFPEAMLAHWCPGSQFGDELASPLNPKLS
jgi:ectoine hydroxylase-related dioxygenase (phytanoyl-CoA dioxygenase family)